MSLESKGKNKKGKIKWDHIITTSNKQIYYIVGDRKNEVSCHSSNMINVLCFG